MPHAPARVACHLHPGYKGRVVSDRHGRTARADNDPRRRPSDGFRVRDAARFPRVVADAVAGLPDRLRRDIAQSQLRIVDVPVVGPSAADEVPLADFDGAVLTVYRRPVESRADSRTTLEEMVMIAVGQAIARHRGWGDALDDLFGE